MRKRLIITLLGLTILFPAVNVKAESVKKEIDWKTRLPVTISERVLDILFDEEDYEPKTMYVTTRLNKRPVPTTESEVIEVLNVNTEVKAVAEYKGWTRIAVENEDGEEEYFYLWNEYLSDEKVETQYVLCFHPDTSDIRCDNSSTTNTYSVKGKYLGTFKLTAYCNCSSCCGKWAGGATASGVMPVAGRTVAMAGVPFGTKLLINGNVYTVEDRGTPYGHVDIYFNSHGEALNFGLQYADVYRVD